MSETKKKAAVTYKNNFWSTVRVENNITIPAVRDYLRSQGLFYSEGAVGMFFSGQSRPKIEVCNALCDLFDVDKTQGWLEFQHAYTNWQADHQRTAVVVAQADTVVHIPDTELVELASTQVMTVEEVKQMLETRKQFALQALYGHVDQSIYEKIRTLFEVNL